MKALARLVLLAAPLLGSAPWLVSAPAFAQDDGAEPPAADARELFLRAVELSDQERWGEAVELFRRSWAITERASTAYNLAVALLRLGHPNEALGALEDYLRVADPTAEAERREQAEALLETARAAIAHVTLTVDPVTASVRANGELVEGEGALRELRLDPGTHTLRVEAEGREPSTFELAVLAGERATRAVTLDRLTGPGELRVASDVEGARISVDGVEVGRGSFIGALPAGRHVVEVFAEGYEPLRRTFAIETGERHELQASLSPVGGNLAEDPIFWTVTLAIAAAIAAAIGLGVAFGTELDPPYGGNTDVILLGLEAAF